MRLNSLRLLNFRQHAETRVDFDVGLTMKDQALGGALVLKDGKAYVKLGNVGYQIPAAITRVLTAPAAEASNGITKTAAMFHINPQNWQRDAHVTATTSAPVAAATGEDTTAPTATAPRCARRRSPSGAGRRPR